MDSDLPFVRVINYPETAIIALSFTTKTIESFPMAGPANCSMHYLIAISVLIIDYLIVNFAIKISPISSFCTHLSTNQ